MSACSLCGKPTVPFKFRVGRVDPNPVSICRSCRGKRAGAVNRAKREKHGADYFTTNKAKEMRNARG